MDDISKYPGSRDAPEQSTFAEIRRRLDTCGSYLILENTTQAARWEDLEYVYRAIEAADARIQEKRFYRDKETGRLFMVARIDTDSDEIWKENMIFVDLPGGINLYFYGKNI